ncbi:mucin-3A-like [Branchiostoma lanceolatum]|uniref:mucin-3A-like n=1 Tax=Branchiostoma lanceolatum TaxID=7740 RepID=UPI0034513F04
MASGSVSPEGGRSSHRRKQTEPVKVVNSEEILMAPPPMQQYLHSPTPRNQHGGTQRSRAQHDGDAEQHTSHSHLFHHHQPTIRSQHPPRVMVSPNTSMKPGDRSLPIRCVIETTLDSGVIQEMESYAIIPCSTFFLDLVGVVLGKLGYSTVQSVVATGHMEVKNWKPLPFNAISDNPQATVGHVLGEVFHLAVLRIKLSRLRWETPVQEPQQETPLQTVAMPTMSPVQDQTASLLTSAPPPQQQSVIAAVSSVTNRQPVVMSSPPAKPRVSEVSQRLEVSSPELDAATSSRIHQNHQVAIKLQGLLAHKPVNTLVNGNCPLTKTEIDQLMRGEFHAEIPPHKHKAFHEWYAKVTTPNKTSTNRDAAATHTATHSANKKLSGGSGGSHGPIKHRKRFRTTFSLEHEIPKLMAWFREDPRPDPMKINRYLQELNNSEVRKHQAPLRYQAVHIWFKNARAKYKKEGLYTPRHKNGFRRGSMIGPIGSLQMSGYSSNVARIQPGPLSHSVLALQHARTVSIPVSAPTNVTPSSIPSQQIPTVVPMSMMSSPTLVSMVTSPGVASPAPTVGSLVTGVVNSIMASMSASEKGVPVGTHGSKVVVKDDPDMPKRSPLDNLDRDGVEKTMPSSDHNGNRHNDTGTLIAPEVEKRVLEDAPRVIVKTENVSAIPDEVSMEEEEESKYGAERSRKSSMCSLDEARSRSASPSERSTTSSISPTPLIKKAPAMTPKSEEVVSPKDGDANDSVPVQVQVAASQYTQHNNQTMSATTSTSSGPTQLGNGVTDDQYTQHNNQTMSATTTSAGAAQLGNGVTGDQYTQHNNQTTSATTTSAGAAQLGNGVTGKSSRATRRRLIINPVSELPKLQMWFNVNPKPSRSEMKKMTEELNASEWRRNQPFELKSVSIWFKNARAKVAKKEHSLDMDTSNDSF